MKIEAAVNNASAFLKIQEEFGAKLNRWKSERHIPSISRESDSFSKDLKQRGFSFVGSTDAYPYMQAAGLVNDHLVDCFRYRAIQREIVDAI